MTSKLTIDQEIDQLKAELASREDTHPDYMPLGVRKLQSLTLASHARLERGLETRIYREFKGKLGKVDNKVWWDVKDCIEPLVDVLSFRNKLDIVMNYQDGTSGLARALIKANTYRIEFSHPDGMKLKYKYNPEDPKGRQNIRDLLRCLTLAEQELDNYYRGLVQGSST